MLGCVALLAREEFIDHTQVQAARLVLQPLFIDVAGERVNLVGDTEQRGKDATAGAAVTTFITPFGLLITGKSAVVKAGSAMFGRVRTDVAVLPQR